MRSAPKRGTRNERGFALLLVLWTLVVISLIGTALLAGSRATTRQETTETVLTTLRAEADAAIQTALYHLLAEGHAHWLPDGAIHRLTEPDLTADVTIQLETGKINPNIAPPGLLTSVFQTAGLQAAAAQTLARMVVLWRTPPSLTQQANRQATTNLIANLGACKPAGRPLRTFDDLAAIPGMTPSLLRTLAPHLSFTQNDVPSPRTQDPFIRAIFDHMQPQLMGSASPMQGTSLQPGQDTSLSDWTDRTLIVSARVRRAGGYVMVRRAVVAPQLGHTMPFAYLSLETIGERQTETR
ncbi:type II secretion system protein GspK [Acetobacter orleanensis]|uniref:Type II secretion system protein K n=1 Tax=Acetobacter orleanensis TaxID=104099 RepID=A0A4Y3TQ12_9PROT|nr:type II secretion system protein GspK [Acetobacter orleanensis]GAN67290.1 general secretion pathway protein K [Acetobacter orleanensis JCM 7639]GEB83549.1 type II secretion system protein K [Acetobacter orleanensis]